jgi:NTE family protein
MRFLADAGLLGRVRYVSSVSGGSITNALLALAYPRLQQGGFALAAMDEHVIDPLLDKVSKRSLKWKLIRNAWRVIGPTTRTQVLARMFKDWWFDEHPLADLSPDVRWIFNAANITTGVRFGFEREVVGDYVIGAVRSADTRLRVADAVASSAAVPGAFTPFEITGVPFPCQGDRKVLLLDGGTYDNSGLQALDQALTPAAGVTPPCLVALNAGGLFKVGRYGRVPIVRELARAEALLYRQSTALRRRQMVERFKVWEQARDAGQPSPSWGRQGVLFGLATTIDPAEEWADGRPEFPGGTDALRLELAQLHTTFDRFPLEQCRQLIHRGWWLTGATLTTFHRDLLPHELPRWSPLRGG